MRQTAMMFPWIWNGPWTHFFWRDSVGNCVEARLVAASHPGRMAMRLVQMLRPLRGSGFPAPFLESVKHFALALLRDELVEVSHYLVAPGDQRLDCVLGQIRPRRVKHLVVTELP